MRTHHFRFLVSLFVLAAVAAGPASGAVTAPGYVVGAVPLPDVVAADVAVAGSSMLVGQGSFGAGQQSIVRRDSNGVVTTLVTNLNAIGGLAYDAAGDRLLFTDNGGDIAGATTGDTLYALPSPLTAAAAVDAATVTLLPDGSIPFAQAVVPLAGGDVLVGDAAGPGAGRVVRVSGGVPTDLITGLDYTAGVALTLAGDEILVGNVDGSFVGAIHRYSLAGASLGALVTGLSGALDQARAASGNLLVTGGFTPGFTSSTVVAVTPAGAVSQIAEGFGFTSGIAIDGPTQQVLVLDFGATHVDTLTPVDGMTPGSFGSKECHLEIWGGAPERTGSGKPKPRWSCSDGDPACDRDGTADGTCTFTVGVCLTVPDPRAPKCTPVGVNSVIVASKTLPGAVNMLSLAAGAVLPTTTSPVCSRLSPVTVPADGRSRSISFDAHAPGNPVQEPRLDKDTLKFRCRP